MKILGTVLQFPSTKVHIFFGNMKIPFAVGGWYLS